MALEQGLQHAGAAVIYTASLAEPKIFMLLICHYTCRYMYLYLALYRKRQLTPFLGYRAKDKGQSNTAAARTCWLYFRAFCEI